MSAVRRAVACALLGACAAHAQDFRGEPEFRKLLPDIDDACALVRSDPEAFPYRSLPFGPLSLEVRKAADLKESRHLMNFHLGVVAQKCRMSYKQVTDHFFCGPTCPPSRLAHLAMQTTKLRALAAAFEKLPALRTVAIWYPKGELRVNDVFSMSGTVREAVPSPEMGFVPSGEWKPWPSLKAYLDSIGVDEGDVTAVQDLMWAVGLSALVREPAATRLVGVGVGDNESGVLLVRPGGAAPQRMGALSDHKQPYMVIDMGNDLYYYETH